MKAFLDYKERSTVWKNGPCFGCMWWHNKSFRLRVYFYTQMPATLIRLKSKPLGFSALADSRLSGGG
jgi:hypothetical protein